MLSYGTDAMITVALAGTVFFGASAHAQRGNVLLYLLVTMAPFALVAPVIGPALDRLQHGRRWTMAGTAVGRAVLAVIMAAHPSDLLVLYPCALGSLVLSKAYGVIRAAAAPRLVPPGMTLTQANSRLSIFGLGSTVVLGGVVGIVIKITGSYSVGLWLTAIGFGVCAYFAFRLPPQVDSAAAGASAPAGAAAPAHAAAGAAAAPASQLGAAGLRPARGHRAAGRVGAAPAVRPADDLSRVLRRGHRRTASMPRSQLGAVSARPASATSSAPRSAPSCGWPSRELMIVTSVAITAAVCILVAITFSIMFAVIGMFVSAVANALSKIALDSLIQRDVVETLRSSAFARSETFLQLAWVVGAAIGVVLPSDKRNGGAIGFWVAARDHGRGRDRRSALR